MKNQDRSAFSEHPGNALPECRGLSKLEYAAIAAMQGLLANQEFGGMRDTDVAKISLASAKALLAELDKEVGE